MELQFENSLGFAKNADSKDPLKKFRKLFLFPALKGRDSLYFTGNSLGLQPRSAKNYIEQELRDWADHGVEGHFDAKNPWFSYHELLSGSLAKLCGAKKEEVVAMNQLSSNLHFLMVSFYRPTSGRYKIICESTAFPSDQYLLESQVRFHGFNPADAIVEIAPRKGEYRIREEDILKAIRENRKELALVFFGGVNYLSGQVFNMKSITEAAHKAGAVAGFDLAHAMGNIQLKLHDWKVDFAAWCSYKYLNSGPGSVGGAFIHSKHHKSNLPRFAGWWGYDKNSRFKMEKGFRPIPTAEGWQVSNAPVLSMAAHKAALDIFDEAGINRLIEKSKKLTAYLEFVLQGTKRLEIITPKERGAQLSIIAHGYGKALYKKLSDNGVIADWREPNVIRFAPAPLYNSFEDVYRLGEILKRIC